MKIVTFDFEEHGDERGILISLEENHNIPFDIRRCYFMYNTQPGVSRGFHAHKTLQQAMDLCPEGFRLPDSTEWRTIVPKVREMESFVASSGYGASRRYNLFWTSSEKDSETQYCYEYVLKQNSDISYFWDILAGDLIECPKDLYPMVQALCISEEE